MPRLGDLLIGAGRVSQAQVDDAARAQVAYGGRLGTNLVELGYLEIDELATYLGRQHRLPAAERRHFERADAELAALLPAALAGKHRVVPLARLASDSRRVAVAALGPLAPEARAEIAGALGCAPEALVVAVAAELRILYNLERVYGLVRPTRFLRTHRGSTQDAALVVAAPDDFEDEPASRPGEPTPAPGDDPLAIPRAIDAEPTPPPVSDAVLEISSGAADGVPEGPLADVDTTAHERRRFVRTIADDTEPPPTEPSLSHSQSLGRIHLRRLAFGAAVEGPTADPQAGLPEALRAIRRCRKRDQIGELAVECLARHGGGMLDAAVLFVARGPIAVVWRGYAERPDVAFDQLAVPLDPPSVLARETGNTVRRLVSGSDELGPLDRRLVGALASLPPAFVLAVPIAIRDQLIGYVYGQGRGDAAACLDLLFEVAEATRAALTGLLRAAQR